MMPKPLERKPLALCITTALLMSNFYCTTAHAETFLATTTLYYYGSGNSNGNGSDFTSPEVSEPACGDSTGLAGVPAMG